MIGEAEIKELMCEYAEALKLDGLEACAQAPSWPLTLAPEGAEPVAARAGAMFGWPFMRVAEDAEGATADERRSEASRA